jgi:chromate reductase, NAD(P)H dehydrogenase (quinone)
MQVGKPCTTSYLIFGASLRAGSLNERLASLAEAIVKEAGGTVVRATMRDFDCPSYDQDVEMKSGIPEGADRFRSKLMSTDGFIVSSPEYNASMPGVLKNLIDWVSRYKPQPIKGRHALLLSASPSMVGGNRGLWALRMPLEHLGARVWPDMFSLAQAHEAFGADGKIADAKLQKWFEGTVDCFIESVEAAKHYPLVKSQWIEFLGEHPTPATERVEFTEIPPV